MQTLGKHFLLLTLRQPAQNIVAVRHLLLIKVLLGVLAHYLKVPVKEVLLEITGVFDCHLIL